MRNRLLASGVALVLGAVVLLAAPAPLETTAAWVDQARFAASARASASFSCQQGPVIVTTKDSAPAQSLTVNGIDPACAGAAIDVRVRETIAGVPGQVALVSTFDSGTEGWGSHGGGGGVTRVTSPVRSGSGALQAVNRTATFHGPSRDITNVTTAGRSYRVSVWVRHGEWASQSLQLTLTETRGGTPQFRPISAVNVPRNTWTLLSGDIVMDPQATQRTIYVEAPNNATLSYVIDDVRVEVPEVPSTNRWITGGGSITLPSPTFSASSSFQPVAGNGTMPVEVTIGGYPVAATWQYTAPAPVAACTVVRTGTSTPVPGATCTAVTVAVTGGHGNVGSRVRQLTIGFTGTGVLTDGTHEIQFTTDLSKVSGIPSDFRWNGASVMAGGFSPVPGYSCASLPTFSARAPGWAVGTNPAYFELHEQGFASPVCGS